MFLQQSKWTLRNVWQGGFVSKPVCWLCAALPVRFEQTAKVWVKP